jgi:ABC-type lipoprotein release transport system permease subunit
MGRVALVGRLAARDLRRRPGEAALLLLMVVAATTVLTVGLVLRGVTNQPYESTRAATAGPDVVASVASPPAANGSGTTSLASLEALIDAPGVVDHSGPYPVTHAEVDADGVTRRTWVLGRSTEPVSVDQPQLTQGDWVDDGGVVLEAAFAESLGLGAGDRITIDDRSFEVVGVAVSAATPPYPGTCFAPCWFGAAAERAASDASGPRLEPPGGPVDIPPIPIRELGLVWLTEEDARNLASERGPLAYVVNLKLADPAIARGFVDAHLPDSVMSPMLVSWQDVLDGHSNVVANQRRALLTGSWLLCVLAVASIAVLVGGRMSDQIRRVGLIKAVGGTPSLVASVLLAEYVVVAIVAAGIGLTAGWLAAPLLTDAGVSLVGRAGRPALTPSTVAAVTVVALGVAAAATIVPAVRAARTSTVLALADSARPPRRTAWLIALSARLPLPLLLGLRVAARRPRRAVLSVLSFFVTVMGLVAALTAHVTLESDRFGAGLEDLRRDRLDEVLLALTLTLVGLVVVNTVFLTWATVLDARHSAALARALGASARDVSAGLSAAQLLPALVGAILGIPGGITLTAALSDSFSETAIPPLWSLLAVVLGTALVVAALTTIPARLGGRRSVAETLRAEFV